MSMKEKLLNLKLPKIYEENLFVYKLGLDNCPEWIDAIKKGWTREEYEKLNKLIQIERLKYILNNEELKKVEIKQINKLINKAIKEYNKM